MARSLPKQNEPTGELQNLFWFLRHVNTSITIIKKTVQGQKQLQQHLPLLSEAEQRRQTFPYLLDGTEAFTAAQEAKYCAVTPQLLHHYQCFSLTNIHYAHSTVSGSLDQSTESNRHFDCASKARFIVDFYAQKEGTEKNQYKQSRNVANKNHLYSKILGNRIKININYHSMQKLYEISHCDGTYILCYLVVQVISAVAEFEQLTCQGEICAHQRGELFIEEALGIAELTMEPRQRFPV